MTLSIALRVPLSPYIGYGNDGIGIARTLIDLGADVHIVPGNLVDSPLPADVAELFTKPKLDKYDISLHHLDPDSFFNDVGWDTVAGLKIGWTMWEFSNLKNSAGWSSLPERLKDYDVFFAYDQNTADALREVYDGEIRVLQGGYLPENHPFVERDWFNPDHFRFCMVGQLHERKDPYLAIQAFVDLKHEYPEEFEGAELHLKNGQPGAFFPQMNEVYAPLKIRIYDEIWEKDLLDQFYGQMHVLLAPSRGEGKNMPALEFLSSGGTVIATNWGGHTGWLNKAYAYPLDYTLRPMSREHPETLNARADLEHLKSLMLHLYRNRAEAKEHGERASNAIPASMSWDSVIHRLFSHVTELEPKLKNKIAALAVGRDDDD